MWNFQANQAPTVEGFWFTNLSTAPVAYYLAFGDNPTTYINTEAQVRYNTFTNNQSNPSGFSAVIFDLDTSENGEKNVATDNDFFCSQSAAHNDTNTGSITSGSNVLTGTGTSFTTFATVGERVRVSYAAGILDTTVSSITNDTTVVMAANAASNQSHALITFGQAYGTGITIGSVNSKHNTLERDSFTQCQYGLLVDNGSFSAAHFGGSANDNLVYINDISEPSELDYLEDENSLRDLWTGNLDATLTLSHMRNSNTSAESNGFIYFGAGGGITITGSVLQDAVNTNAVLIGAATPSSVNLTSIGNYWSPGASTMASFGFGAWRTAAEGGFIDGGTLISCGDFGIADAPGWCYQFGDGATEGGTNEGNIVISSNHFSNDPSFNSYTAEPHAGNTAFVNEARGFQTNFVAGNNSTSMNFVGFDAGLSPNAGGYAPAMRGGNTIGYRFTMPIVNSTAQPSSIGLLVNPPTANTLITNAYGVYVGNLASVAGITNHYSFYSGGATDTMFLAGLFSVGGQITSTLATGTAPFSITSATPVANLTASNHPQVYEAGVLTTAEKIYTNTQALTTGGATHTFANSFTYTSSSTFGCTCTDQTAANACKAVPASATTVTLAGTGSDTLWLSCSGH